jgi:hypothetical protein
MMIMAMAMTIIIVITIVIIIINSLRSLSLPYSLKVKKANCCGSISLIKSDTVKNIFESLNSSVLPTLTNVLLGSS